MPAITLPDGSVRSFDAAVTGAEIAADIGPGLAKAAIAVRINGKLSDLSVPITEDSEVALLTKKNDEALELIRHDCAHIMAEAVLELYPETQVTIGPAIENGFYYDFYREEHFTPEDLEKIEQRMHEIVDRDEQITREEWDRDEAVLHYKKVHEPFKVELVETIPSGETISFYRQGGFLDLCRGPHMPSTKYTGHAFKLMSVAGAYWRGDSNRPQLQRIYGTAWPDQKQLDAYLHMLEEAEKRDHRKLGRELDLFHIQEEAVGSVFWHPHGWTLYRTIENHLRKKLDRAGYNEVKTPQLIDRSLWEASGHWEKFRENMFTANAEDDKVLALKPMNCPGHVQIFKQGLKSYRDLPLRLSEYGSCHRNEPSGALHGIMRVRAFTQDDAHIFCTEDQITSESVKFCELLSAVYKDFGFTDVRVKFSDRPEVRAGSDAIWDKAESSLRDACDAAGHAAPGDLRLHGALDRHPDRTVFRPLPALARAGAGRRCHHYQRRGRLCREGDGGLQGGGTARRDGPPEREDQLQDSRALQCQDPGDPRRRPPRGGGRQGGATAARRTGTRSPCA
jgi:threonyl-tRNA synthetase